MTSTNVYFQMILKLEKKGEAGEATDITALETVGE